MNENYSKIIDKLFLLNTQKGMKLGLENALNLNRGSGNPDKEFKSIHVAGTNGKGSVTLKTARGLEKAGFRVGLYISPHISTFRERISINGQMISEQSVCKHVVDLFSLMETLQIPATFFELTTILAFRYFAEHKVDYAVVETGLGGRFDATNIIQPILSVITSISLDHTDVLGSTLNEIAYEKAGIAKPGIPVIIGPRTYTLRNLLSTCKKVEGEFDSYEEENREIARQVLRTLNVGENAIEEGISSSLPCRMEKIPDKPVILDVAHNPDGLTQLFKSMRRTYGDKKIRIVFGLSKNKDMYGCLNLIREEGVAFHIVEATNGRGIAASELYTEMLKLGVDRNDLFETSSITDGIQNALTLCNHDEIILICGTFFIMREARAALGMVEACDSVDMNERNKK